MRSCRSSDCAPWAVADGSSEDGAGVTCTRFDNWFCRLRTGCRSPPQISVAESVAIGPPPTHRYTNESRDLNKQAQTSFCGLVFGKRSKNPTGNARNAKPQRNSKPSRSWIRNESVAIRHFHRRQRPCVQPGIRGHAAEHRGSVAAMVRGRRRRRLQHHVAAASEPLYPPRGARTRRLTGKPAMPTRSIEKPQAASSGARHVCGLLHERPFKRS
jgi:hypothetical protein